MRLQVLLEIRAGSRRCRLLRSRRSGHLSLTNGVDAERDRTAVLEGAHHHECQEADVADDRQPDVGRVQVGLCAGGGDLLGLGADGAHQGTDAHNLYEVVEPRAGAHHDVAQQALGEYHQEHVQLGVLGDLLQEVHVTLRVGQRPRGPERRDGDDDHDVLVEAAVVVILVDGGSIEAGDTSERREHECRGDSVEILHCKPSRRPKGPLCCRRTFCEVRKRF